MQNWIKTVVVAVSLALPGVVLAQSLESLVNVQGVRENQLVGYSLVVGLDGTGDKNQVKFTNQTITNMLRQFGVQLPNKIDPKVKNVAAVSHGSLTVSINETSNVSQPNAFAGGRTAVTPQSNIAVNHARPGVVSLPESSSLKTLVNALNSLGATPDDIMSILQALHEAGALDADLGVI